LFNGIEQFQNPTWFALNSDLDWVLKCESHSRFDDVDWVDEYGRPVRDESRTREKRASELVSERMNVV